MTKTMEITVDIKNAKKMLTIAGYSVNSLSDDEIFTLALQQAEDYACTAKECTAITFPCTLDSDVWYADRYSSNPKLVHGTVIDYTHARSLGHALKVHFDEVIEDYWPTKDIPVSEVGKILFTSLEEAQKAYPELLYTTQENTIER